MNQIGGDLEKRESFFEEVKGLGDNRVCPGKVREGGVRVESGRAKTKIPES